MQDQSLLSAIQELASAERAYQECTLSLVASDNYASEDTLSLMASAFNNKCAEAYPGQRSYAGLENYDRIENIAVELSMNLFGVSYANVQAYSGSSANLAVMSAFMSPDDTVLGLAVDSGGHFSHGHVDNISSRCFRAATYETQEDTNLLDYDRIRETARRCRPKLIVSGASCYPRRIDFDRINEIAKEVGARHLCDISHISGLVIAGQHPDPASCSDAVTTTTHKMLRGPRGALILSSDSELGQRLNDSVFPHTQGSCHMHKIASIAVCLAEATRDSYGDYVQNAQLSARYLADRLQRSDIDVLTGGTDTHMFIVRSTNAVEKTRLLRDMNILCNPVILHGSPDFLRFGTCALASRGVSREDLDVIADVLEEVIAKGKVTDLKRKEYIDLVSNLVRKRPIPEHYR